MKTKFVVEKTEEETNPRGITLLKVFVRSGGKLYTFGAKKADYLDARKRGSIHQVWIKDIKEQMDEADTSVKKKKNDEKALAGIVGKEYEEEEE